MSTALLLPTLAEVVAVSQKTTVKTPAGDVVTFAVESGHVWSMALMGIFMVAMGGGLFWLVRSMPLCRLARMSYTLIFLGIGMPIWAFNSRNDYMRVSPTEVDFDVDGEKGMFLLAEIVDQKLYYVDNARGSRTWHCKFIVRGGREYSFPSSTVASDAFDYVSSVRSARMRDAEPPAEPRPVGQRLVTGRGLTGPPADAPTLPASSDSPTGPRSITRSDIQSSQSARKRAREMAASMHSSAQMPRSTAEAQMRQSTAEAQMRQSAAEARMRQSAAEARMRQSAANHNRIARSHQVPPTTSQSHTATGATPTPDSPPREAPTRTSRVQSQPRSADPEGAERAIPLREPPATSQQVVASTPLTIGTPVIAEWGNRYYAAEVLSLAATGEVRVHYLGYASGYDESLPRDRLWFERADLTQHTGAETSPPSRPDSPDSSQPPRQPDADGLASHRTPATAMRRWNDNTGKHSIEAQLVEFADGKVTLLRADGKRVQLPLSRLSVADREFASRHGSDLAAE